jgi:hypothetical protein
VLFGREAAAVSNGLFDIVHASEVIVLGNGRRSQWQETDTDCRSQKTFHGTRL